MLAEHHPGGDRVVEHGSDPNRPLGGDDLHPLPLGDATGSRCLRVQLDLRVRSVPAQVGDLTMLGLAGVERLGAAEHEGKVAGEIGTRAGAQRRFSEGRDRRLADIEERLLVQLDPSGRRVEPGRNATVAGRRVLPVVRLQRKPDAGGFRAQLLEGHPTRLELVFPRGVDVAVEELLAQSQPYCQIEDDSDVGAGFTHKAHQRRPELHQRLGLLGDLEPDLQSLGLEGDGDREDDVGQLGGRAHEMVQMDVEVERPQRLPATCAVALGHGEVRPEAHQPAGTVCRGWSRCRAVRWSSCLTCARLGRFRSRQGARESRENGSAAT